MTRGLTLIELVVAMAVFALVAVMGLQSLSGSLRMRDRLVTIADDTADLGQATALLRNDLAAIVPMLFFPPREGRPLSALRASRDGQGFAMSLGGQPGLATVAGGVDAATWQRAEWRLDAANARLTRQVWPTVYPVSARQAGPAVPVFEGVTGLGLRSYWAGKGWVPGLSPPRGAPSAAQGGSADGDSAGSAPESYSSTLPHAIEITLETRDHGQIVLLEYLQ
jgi:general secretion pathway protein J